MISLNLIHKIYQNLLSSIDLAIVPVKRFLQQIWVLKCLGIISLKINKSCSSAKNYLKPTQSSALNVYTSRSPKSKQKEKSNIVKKQKFGIHRSKSDKQRNFSVKISSGTKHSFKMSSTRAKSKNMSRLGVNTEHSASSVRNVPNKPAMEIKSKDYFGSKKNEVRYFFLICWSSNLL